MKATCKPLIISLCIHALLFISILPTEQEQEDKSPSGGHVKVRIDNIINKEVGVAGKTCPDWFGGIGVTVSLGDMKTIATVHKGYPAEKAGLLPGDIITSGFFGLRGVPGTSVSIKVLRSGQEMVFNMIRDKICTTGD